jgi:hypothetical protein
MKTQKHALRFKITLLGHSPRVWRRIEVPSTYSFWDLHVAIQDAMGWLDYHLHNFSFQVGTNRIDIGIPEEGDTETTQLPDWEVDMADYFTEVGVVAQYEYDFGDSWIHEVRFEKYLPQVPGTKYPRCTGGAGACPPEDCGGISGYSNLLRLLRKPSHEDYESTVVWLNGQTRKKWPYDLKAFDPTKVRFDNPRARFRKAFS